jgi:hypothetical protein
MVTNQGTAGEQGKPGFCEKLERAMGIEPTSEAWEASILPLYDARSRLLNRIIHNCNRRRKRVERASERRARFILSRDSVVTSPASNDVSALPPSES